MKYSDLSNEDKAVIIAAYNRESSQADTQSSLASMFGVTTRTIRNWANSLGLTGVELSNDFKIMVYDIETSRVTAKKTSLFEILANKFPINNFPKRLQIFSTSITIIYVVSMLPNITS